MTSISLVEVSMIFFCFFIFFYFLIKKNFDYKKAFQSYPWNWPVYGMAPGLLVRLNRIYDAVEVLEKHNMTFLFKGPWFTGKDMLVTVDPANINHVMCLNFSRYAKGPEFQEVLEVFGNGLITSELEQCINLRKGFQAMLHDQRFQSFLICTTRNKLKEELLPLFGRCAEEGTILDLQDVFRRFTFDTTLITLGTPDPKSLSFQMAANYEFGKAIENVEAAIKYRMFLPRYIWKLQNWMRLGQEKKMIEGDAIIARLCEKYIADKRDEIRKEVNRQSNNGDFVDVLTFFMSLEPLDDRVLRSIILSYFLAVRENIAYTLTWFFWLLSENPQVVTKIQQEIQENLPRSESGLETPSYDLAELDKLVYLHGALCESLRLYPSVPFERRSAIKPDVLPSGHKIDVNSKIMIFVYAMGRMKAIWGEDALEFKPERWISTTGGIRHEPSYKFFSFNAGQRACPGKNMAMTLLKTVVVAMLQNYYIEVVKGQKIEPLPGITLQMKHGLRAAFKKRC